MLPRFFNPRVPPRIFHPHLYFDPSSVNQNNSAGRPFAAQAHRTTVDMDKAYLRNVSNTNELHITFRYVSEKMHVDRDFNFCRRMNERVDEALVRIRCNLEKEFTKRSRRNRRHDPATINDTAATTTVSVPSEINIGLYRNGSKDCVTGITFAELLHDMASGLQLHVVDKQFDIVLNHPWIINLHLPNTILANHLVYPNKFEIQFATREHSLGEWYKSTMPPSGDLNKDGNWELCGTGLAYEVMQADIGHYLKFLLKPGNERGIFGPTAEHIAKWPVQPGPGICPFQLRQHYTSKPLSEPDELRVVTYNLLADLYADSEYSRKTLFPYCLPYALEIDYRKQLFVKELLGYNADILCLQEVDLKTFDIDFKTVLEQPPHNFHGIMAPKGATAEGAAIFYRTTRLKLLNSYVLALGDNITRLPIFAALWNKIKDNVRLAARICDRSTTLEVCLLKLKDTEKYVLVANTHLYFHPDADHIRLLQTGFSLIYIDHIYQQAIKMYNIADPSNIGIIFCGDFNSVPKCGIYKLMTEQFVGTDSEDWKSNLFEACTGVELTQPFKMGSACGTPEFTNFTVLFSGCLDYIFYQCDRFDVLQSVPMPSIEELTLYKAIPSVTFPSDHIALVADLKFKSIE